MIWMNMVEDFNFDTKAGETCSIDWGHPKQKLSLGDRVVIYKKGDQKIVAIGTVTNGKKDHNALSHGLNLRYDIVNPIGVAAGSQHNQVLSHQEFENILIRVLRGY